MFVVRAVEHEPACSPISILKIKEKVSLTTPKLLLMGQGDGGGGEWRGRSIMQINTIGCEIKTVKICRLGGKE